MVLELEQLPNDVTEHVAKNLNPRDLIELSFCSEAWFHLISSFKTRIKELYINCKELGRTSENNNLAKALIGVKPFQRSFVHIFVYQRTLEELDEFSGDPKTCSRVFGERELKCQIDKSTIKVFTMDPIDTFYSVMEHLLNLFTGSIHHVNFGQCTPNITGIILKLLKMEGISSCNTLSIPSGGAITSDLLEYLLQNPNLFCLNINCAVRGSFQFVKEVNITHLSLTYPEWVTNRNILNFHCETINLEDPNINGIGLNSFIKTWMKTDKKKLKRLSISFCKGWNWEDGNNIFDGIEYELFDKNLNSGTQFYEDEEMIIHQKEQMMSMCNLLRFL